MASTSLDALRDAANQKHGNTDITVGDEVVRLLNPLRLSKDKRKQLIDIQKRMNAESEAAEGDDESGDGDGGEQEELLREAIRTVAATPKQADLLLSEIGDDLAVLMEVFTEFTREQEAGEASASAN